MNSIDVENELSNNVSMENKQREFLQTGIGKAVNTGLNIGLRYLLPDVIEDQIIEIKDSFIQNGFKEGIKTAIDTAINFGKSAMGIFTGNFENIEQMQTAVKSGGIIDGISSVLNFTINKVVDNGKLPYAVGKTLKAGKNALMNNITKNIEGEFENQVNNIEKLEKYTKNWSVYFNNKDFDGMQWEFEKIKDKIKNVAPIENTIKNARTVENLHMLIKNNGKNFNLTDEELALVKML